MPTQLHNLQTLLKKNTIEAILVSDYHNIAYLTGFNGFVEEDRDAFLLVTPRQQFIFTHSMYVEAAEKYIKDFTLIRMSRENPISAGVAGLIKELQLSKLHFEAFDLTVEEYLKLTKNIPAGHMAPTHLIEELRIIKTPEEIKKIQQACIFGDMAFDQILDKFRPGVTEKEIAALLNNAMRLQGAEISFMTIVAFGRNASHPHHVPSETKLKKNEFILMDFGVKYDGYCSDMTRTVFLGNPKASDKKIYQTVLEAQQKAIAYIENALQIKTPVRAADADKAARDHVLSQGYPEIIHSIGHGIGMQVHEQPRLSPISQDILTEGMVFSIEPGIYLPDTLGIRIEDLFTIEKGKLVQLTNAPEDLISI